MNAQQIRCFLESTTNLFSTMLSSTVEFGQPEMQPRERKHHDISGIIGLSGEIVGSVVVGFPTETALGAVEAFVGMPVSLDDDNFADAIGELANIIAGGAKAKMEGEEISISCPSVVIGTDYTVQRPRLATCVRIPCRSPFGMFDLVVCINTTAGRSAKAA
ncbi:MAG: chemotaxis protein CheX [Phycisphaerales bacterium JB059]